MFCFVCAHGCLGKRSHWDGHFAGSSDGDKVGPKIPQMCINGFSRTGWLSCLSYRIIIPY